MNRVLRYLSADYARSRIENLTLAMSPLMLAVVVAASVLERAA